MLSKLVPELTDNWYFDAAIVAIIFFILFTLINSLKVKRNKKIRTSWAKKNGFSFKKTVPDFLTEWQAGVLAYQDYPPNIEEIVTGEVADQEIVFFDNAPNYTVFGIKSDQYFPYNFELCQNNTFAPINPDLIPLNEIITERSSWILFTDQSEENFPITVSELIYVLEVFNPEVIHIWNETKWLVGAIPKTTNLAVILHSLSKLADMTKILSSQNENALKL